MINFCKRNTQPLVKIQEFHTFFIQFTGIADSTIDVAAIFGVYETEDEEELKFINNMNDMFFTFVKTGVLPKGEDLSFEKMYLVDSEIATQEMAYPRCDFWKEAQKIVPTYAALD